MNNKIEDALWQNYETMNKELEDGNFENLEEYKVKLEERDKIRNELIKHKQIENENDIQGRQLKSDSKKDLFRNAISLFTFGVTTVFSIWTVVRSFKFDESSTMTSTVGRGAVNGAVTKLLKR